MTDVLVYVLSALVVGFLIGILIGILSGSRRKSRLYTEVELLRSRLEATESRAEKERIDFESRLEAQKAEDAARLAEAKEEGEKALAETKAGAEKSLAESKEEWQRQSAELAAQVEKNHIEIIEAQEKRHIESIRAQQQRFDDTLAKVSAQMKSATDEMLRQRQKEFAESSNTNIGQIVNPLRETIDKMKKAMEDTTLSQTKISSEMKANMENMMRQSEEARKSTEELTRAFKHESQVQGSWGERVLEEILEAHGFRKGLHYDTQEYIRDSRGNIVTAESGTRMRPDVILHLDRVREVVVDSKVSLTAYFDYVNATDDSVRKVKLKEHVDSVKRHVEELSRKDYSSYIKPPKVRMDYVIMFMPHASAWWTAVNAESNLWRWAMSKNVFIADEQTLYAALRMIDLTWTQIRQAQNHEKVYELAGEMLNRVGQFYKAYTDLGDKLDKAGKAYESGLKKLEDKGQSIRVTCHRLEELGVKQNDKNPLPEFIDIDEVPSIEDGGGSQS